MSDTLRPVPRPVQRRIKRAIDLSSKHVYIPKEMQEDPWREYKAVAEVFSETQKEHDERQALSGRWWVPDASSVAKLHAAAFGR